MRCASLQLMLSVIAVIGCVILIADSASLPNCGTEGWRCGNGACIAKHALCDGVSHCSKSEDERDCLSDQTNSENDFADNSCSDTQYQCEDGTCIPGIWVCDNYDDCFYGEDEINCTISGNLTTTRPCGNDQFECWNGQCIPSNWECDGVWDCSQGEDERDCPTTNKPSGTTPQPPPFSCDKPFEFVGDRCVFVNPITSGTWDEARYVCQIMESDLVVLDSLHFFGDLVVYLNETGLTSRDYWVGASHMGPEGKWRWINGDDVRMGTPLWALYGSGSSYEQEPRGPSNYCACLSQSRFYYMDDSDCQEFKGSICQLSRFKTSHVNPKVNILLMDEERLKELLAVSEVEKH